MCRSAGQRSSAPGSAANCSGTACSQPASPSSRCSVTSGFRFEWQFGVGVVATLILVISKTVGVFAVTQIEFDLNSVAALPTLIGYSVTDKVVVYDRIRENLGKYRTMPLRQLIDLSINQTLGRTVVTSLTVVLSILPLALIGGQVMRGFGLAIIFGIVIGTSSSIFIASPILLFLGEKRLRPSQTLAPKTRAGAAAGRSLCS